MLSDNLQVFFLSLCILFLLIDGCDSLFCSFSHLSLCASVNDVFPEVHLNFAGGALMVLKPKDYLLEQNSIVSFPALYLSFQFSLLWEGQHGFPGIVFSPSSSISQIIFT